MWLLSAEDDLFRGHRKWLRPGTKHLLGRISTKQDTGENLIHISHKSVSRKHILLEVGEVKPGASSHLHARSEIRLTDTSKTGTILNGDSFTKSTRIVGESGGIFNIRLGSNGPQFKLQWLPVVLTFTNLPKGSKAKQNALTPYRTALESADIKIITDYVSNGTTHVVAKKRNNASSLQALTQARWVVSEGFVEALKAALQKEGVDGSGEPILDSLDQDFDGQWPKEENFFTPAGPEPHPRPNTFLAPDPRRAEVFEDYLFIFLSRHQYDNLLPVVTSGGGKALCWELIAAESKLEDLLEFTKEATGHKGQASFNLSQQTGRGGAVIVRIPEGDGTDNWWQNFNKQMQEDTGQRSIEQAEFLDAILTTDASALRRPLEFAEEVRQTTDGEDQDRAATPAPVQQHPQLQSAPRALPINVPDSPSEAVVQRRSSRSSQHSSSVRDTSQEVQAQPPTKRQRRLVTQSRFKGFDDFDPSQFTRPASDSDEPSAGNSQLRANLALNAEGMDIDDPLTDQSTRSNLRKRRNGVEEAEDNETRLLESMLQGRNKLKRQRTEAGTGNRGSLAMSNQEAEHNADGQAAKAKKKERETDYVKEAQKNAQKQNEDREQYEEYLRQALDGVDINELSDVAKVEIMEVSTRTPPAEAQDGSRRRDRWDPAWNGRKNFKKFRPRGQARSDVQPRRVIVTLEEVPRETHGLSDAYWSATPSSNRSKSKSKSQSQSIRQGHSVPSNNNEEDDLLFTRRLESSHELDTYDNDNGVIEPWEIAGRPRDSQIADAVQSTASQTLRGTASQAAVNGKRPAVDQGGPATKRTKQSRLPRNVNLNDDDDEDGLGFRRRRR